MNPTDLIGQRFGRYRLEAMVGSGGMGLVFLSTHSVLKRRCAIKVLRPELGASSDLVERFRAEFRLMAQMSHPHLVSVYDADIEHGHWYLVMDYVTGPTGRAESMHDRMALRPGRAIDPDLARRWAIEMTCAVGYAHGMGVVHRDLKPANLLLDDTNSIRVTDFGVARVIDNDGLLRRIRATLSSQITNIPNLACEPTTAPVGPPSAELAHLAAITPRQKSSSASGLVGTLLWMSPEQRQASPAIDHRSDVYTLGLIFYQMLAGRLPGPMARPASHVRGVPAAWDRILSTCMEEDAADRYRDCNELLGDIERIGAGSGGSPSISARSRSLAAGQRTTAVGQAGVRDTIKRAARLWWVLLVLLVLATVIAWPGGPRSLLAQRHAGVNEALPGPGSLSAPRERQPRPVARTTTGPSAIPGRERNLVIQLEDGVQVEMAWIPPGTFTMGSPVTDADRDLDERRHEVTLTRGFWMQTTEVTLAQWVAVMASNPSDQKGTDLPVAGISWETAHAFLRRFNDARQSSGFVFRLPTEAEWEYACRAGTKGTFGGTENLDDMGWYSANSDRRVHPVATRQPNAWGLYDMHGNLWEWCEDWYGDYGNGPDSDPRGPASGHNSVLRGGSWKSGAAGCRSGNRDQSHRSDYYFFDASYYGFRIVAQPK